MHNAHIRKIAFVAHQKGVLLNREIIKECKRLHTDTGFKQVDNKYTFGERNPCKLNECF